MPGDALEAERHKGGEPMKGMSGITGFLGYALGVLTVGVFLIAYGVLVPRTAAFSVPGQAFATADQIGYRTVQPVLAGDRIGLPDGPGGYVPPVYNDTRSP